MNKNVVLTVGGGGEAGVNGERMWCVCDVNGELNPWKEVGLECLIGQSYVLSEQQWGLMVFL